MFLPYFEGGEFKSAACQTLTCHFTLQNGQKQNGHQKPIYNHISTSNGDRNTNFGSTMWRLRDRVCFYLSSSKFLLFPGARGLGTPSPLTNPESHQRGEVKGRLASRSFEPQKFSSLVMATPLLGKQPR